MTLNLNNSSVIHCILSFNQGVKLVLSLLTQPAQPTRSSSDKERLSDESPIPDTPVMPSQLEGDAVIRFRYHKGIDCFNACVNTWNPSSLAGTASAASSTSRKKAAPLEEYDDMARPGMVAYEMPLDGEDEEKSK